MIFFFDCDILCSNVLNILVIQILVDVFFFAAYSTIEELLYIRNSSLRTSGLKTRRLQYSNKNIFQRISHPAMCNYLSALTTSR